MSKPEMSSPPEATAICLHEMDRPGRPSPSTHLIVNRLKTNLAFRTKWCSELNGSMGDLGTYIPIILALALSKNLDLGTTLILTGAYNIITGAIYGVPMPVQPMKSIAAVAISSSDFSVPEIMAAGICTSAVVLLLGATRLMRLAYLLIPLPVVRGVQLAQGLSFAISAVKYMRNQQDLPHGKSLGQRPWLGLDGLLLSIFAASFLILINGAGEVNREVGDDEITSPIRPKTRRFQRIIALIPSAVIVFVLGIILAVIRKPSTVKELNLGPSHIRTVRISPRQWKDGFLKGALPQIPLTLLNSVLAVCKLTADLFPDREATATSVATTVGAMNLVGCWFGAMPCCHGAGGLAGQYKFGGRSGGCVALLGAAKIAVGIVLGGSVLRLLVEFPVGLLGVLLLFAGVELAMACRDMATRGEAFVMLLCAAVSTGSNAGLGFVCGLVVSILLWVNRKIFTE